MTGSRLGIAVAAMLFAFSGSAWADPSTQEKEKARDLMADGRDKRDKADLAGALASFQQADAIMHVPTTGFEVAKTQQALGQLIEAQATCAAIAKLPVNPSDPPPFAEARQKAEQLGKDLDKQIPKLTIVVKSAGTPTVTLDNVAVASLTDPVRVNPGNHTIYAKAPEGEAKQDIAIGASEAKTVELQVASKAATAATPDEGGGLTKKVPLISWVGFGVGAAGLVVGTITGVIALGDKSDIQDHCKGNKCPQTQSDPLSSAKTVAGISTVGFIVAGVGVAVGVVGLFVLKPKAEDAPPPTAALGPIRFDPTTLSGTF